MNRMGACLLLISALGLAACCSAPAQSQPAVAAVPGKVTDVEAFDRFIATAPTPEQFRARYPDVLLVLPGDMATKEFRMDRSRYFAKIDGGRVTGGRFQ